MIVIAVPVMVATIAIMIVVITLVAAGRAAIMAVGHEDAGGKRQHGRKHQNSEFHLRLH
ncbi:hypothetical protein [Nevskia soli]|uniref:hypothetical protein n=1 Tax=Nevskia soli TaxID=418856 RepID=UPI0012FA1E5A|nr:hypothetical protein [Nevskia soli]